MRSIVTGSMAIAGADGKLMPDVYRPWPWDADFLQLAVREPFPSRTSSAKLVYGTVKPNTKLVVHSLMPEGGVIFSDGIEADYLVFSSGTTAEIGVARAKGQLVV